LDELNEEEVMLAPAEGARHVTIWNTVECRKIAGNAAPLRRNLAKYLQRHPECEVYNEQDKRVGGMEDAPVDPISGERLNVHVPMWHKAENRKVTGNAAPLRKNLAAYLKRHPECEVYNGQDKDPNYCPAPPPAPIAEASVTGGINRVDSQVSLHGGAMDLDDESDCNGLGRVVLIETDETHCDGHNSVSRAIPIRTQHFMDLPRKYDNATSWGSHPLWMQTYGSHQVSQGIPIPGRGTSVFGQSPNDNSNTPMMLSFAATPPGIFAMRTPIGSFDNAAAAAFFSQSYNSVADSAMVDFSPSNYLILGSFPHNQDGELPNHENSC